MKDRVSRNPGAYKAMVPAGGMESFQHGEEFDIYLRRNDDPEVEGTPYNKDSVVPDDVAEAVCPGIENPTPADVFRELHTYALLLDEAVRKVEEKIDDLNITAETLGLGNVDNTSDMDKPVSTAQAELFNSIGTSIDSLWDSYWNITSPTNIIKDSNADLDTIATTGDYTIAVNGIKNNPLTGIFENDMGKVYVRNDGYNRCMQFIHPLYGTSYGYAMPMRLYMRIGEIVSGVRKWGAWTEILTSNSGGWGIGKTIVNIGDSIFGNYDSQSITTYLTQFSGATVHNCGFGGTCAADTVHPGTPSQPFDFANLANAICGVITVDGSTNPWKAQDDAMEQHAGWTTYQKHLALIKSVDFSKVDVLTIAYGTNDWGIGAKTLAEIKAALKTGIELINKTYPKMKIVLICPIWRYLNGQSSDTLARGTDAKTLEDYSAEYESLARELKVPFLDTYHNLTLNANNRDKFYVETGTESTHLNPDGRKMYAELIDGKLKTLF